MQPIGAHDARPQPRRTSSPRPSRSRSTPATSCRGIDVTDDPLLQARLFSYLDTQLTRLGGPNFAQIPINRPLAPGQRQPPRRLQAAGRPRRAHAVPAERRRRRLPVPRRRRRRRLRARARGRSTAPRSASARAATTTSARPRCSGSSMTDGRAGPHRRRVHVRARQGRRPGGRRAHARSASRRSTPSSPRARRRRASGLAGRRAVEDDRRRPADRRVAGAGDGHRGRVPARRPGRAHPRQRRRRPRRHRARCKTRSSRPARRRTCRHRTRARSPARAGGRRARPSTARSTPRARPKPTRSSSPAAPSWPTTRRSHLRAGGVPPPQAVGAWGDGVDLLAAAGIGIDEPGVRHGRPRHEALREAVARGDGRAPPLGTRRRPSDPQPSREA